MIAVIVRGESDRSCFLYSRVLWSHFERRIAVFVAATTVVVLLYDNSAVVLCLLLFVFFVRARRAWDRDGIVGVLFCVRAGLLGLSCVGLRADVDTCDGNHIIVYCMPCLCIMHCK